MTDRTGNGRRFKKPEALRETVAGHDAAGLWSAGRSGWGARREARAARPEEAHALARVEATMAAVYWVASADDELSDDEYTGIVDALGELLDRAVDEDELADAIDAWDEALDEDEDRFLQEVSATLDTPALRRNAFELACAVAAADGELSVDEENALGELAGIFELPEAEAEGLAERALKRMGV